MTRLVPLWTGLVPFRTNKTTRRHSNAKVGETGEKAAPILSYKDSHHGEQIFGLFDEIQSSSAYRYKCFRFCKLTRCGVKVV